ncbi:HIT family protein [Patescibacteria group bacterium]|nr:MAG: HIT family protein [Patescibacteria group bacterium]
MDCLFCKIANKEIPNYTIYEDESVLAFLDIHPCAKGHTVVIPKKHFADAGEMDDVSWGALMGGLKKAAAIIYAKIKPDGMNIGANDRPAAGQAVGHAHWHIIPRWEGDGGASMHGIIRKGSAEAVEVTAKLFK